MQDDQESRTVSLLSEIKYEEYKDYLYLLEIRKPSLILTYRAVVTVPTFLIKLSLP